MSTTKEIFGRNLRKIRKDLGLSQEKFAEIIDIQARNLTDIENAKYMPTPANIDKICANLKMPVFELFQMPDEFVDSNSANKIKHINEKLKSLNEIQLNIIYNIVNYAFNDIKS